MGCILCPFYFPALKFHDSPPSVGPCHLPQGLSTPGGGPLCILSSPVTLSALQGSLPQGDSKARARRMSCT